MKTTLFIITLALIPILCFAQPKRSNVIELSTSYASEEEAFVAVSKILLLNTIPIDKSDKDIGLIKTATYTNNSVRIIATIIVNKVDNIVYVRLYGRYWLSAFGEEERNTMMIEYKGRKGSPGMLSWEAIHRIASLIPSKEINYLTI